MIDVYPKIALFIKHIALLADKISQKKRHIVTE